MAKYTVELSEEDIQMIKDCHSKNPSIMKAMKQRQTTITENSMIWCGAGISIAEILTGTYLAPLGFTKGRFLQHSLN